MQLAQRTEAIAAFPVNRASIRRLAQRDADQGKPKTAHGFTGPDAVTYEMAYVEHQCRHDAEHAECA